MWAGPGLSRSQSLPVAPRRLCEMRSPQLVAALCALFAQCAHGFMYRPATGLTWDPSCMTWGGKTYCYFMYVCGTGTLGCTSNETHYGHGLVAVASDGVHFETKSAFNAEVGSVGWFK